MYSQHAPANAPTPVTEWDLHWACAPHDSTRWAATDRGWFFAYTDADKLDSKCLGHYLDYEDFWSSDKIDREGGAVHAVTCEPRASRCFPTVEEAIAWIELQTMGQRGLFG